MISSPLGQAPLVLAHCRAMLETHLPAYLTAWTTSLQATGVLDLMVTLPPPVAIYLGTVEDQQGRYPAVGLYAESVTPRPMVSACYLVEHRIAATVSIYAGSTDSRTPTSTYAAAQAYVSAVVECLSTTVARYGVPLGIYDSLTVSAAAERSPHVIQTTPDSHYETRRALGRVLVRQEIAREVPL